MSAARPGQERAGWEDAEEVLRQVKAALYEALPTGGDVPGVLRLEKVELELKVAAEAEAGAGVKLKVPLINLDLEAGGDVRENRLQVLRLELSPPFGRHEGVGASVQEELVKGLLALQRIAASAADGEYPLDLRRGVLELAFVFERSGKAALITRARGKRELAHLLRLHLAGATPGPGVGGVRAD